MKQWLHNLKVSQKLMLISIFFVMPDSLMLYFFITGINTNIEFARQEQKGNRYQRPLEELLEYIPQHLALIQQAEAGDKGAAEELAQKQAQIDKAFDTLEAVDARIGADLQFTDEGLAKRKREHYRAHTVRDEWRALKKASGLDPKTLAALHQHLVTDVRVMITHAGDLSNLILDPDLDSYYIMDATLLALPQTQDRLASVIARGGKALHQGVIPPEERQQLAIYSTLLKEADFDRIVGSVQTALNEDPNFYGISPTLQARLPVALEEYRISTDEFISLTRRIAGEDKSDIPPAEYVAKGNRARAASFKLWRVAEEEMDTLLQTRIESYQNRRSKSLIVAALAAVAACGLVTFITKSISGPLRKQAAALQTANDSLQAEIAERERVETALRTAEEKYRSIFENSVEGIFQTTADGQYRVANQTLARMYGYDSVDELQAVMMTDISVRLYVDSQRRAEFQRRVARDGTLRGFESEIFRKDGGIIWISENARAVYDTEGALLYYEGTVADITERKRNEAELEKLNRQLVETSRQAGMAEVATGVLHNVGNVLNSVNVSAMLIVDRLSKSRVAHLANVSVLLRDNAGDLGRFLTEDPKGRKLPSFIGSLADRLTVEQAELLRELEGLTRNVAHIKEIVAVQQSYAKVSGVTESLVASDLVEDALEMNGAAFDRHGVDVIRDFEDVPLVRVDKHKVLQVLINVIRNAKYTVSESYRPDKRITVRIWMNGNRRVRISVADNGIGIARENLARIFAHGFTTKKDGHGFGLHSAALAATETGGSLAVHSDGTGQGATFTLELPAEEPDHAPPRRATTIY